MPSRGAKPARKGNVMKPAISAAALFLETAFDKLNARFFEGALPRPVITIQSSPRTYGHCSVKEIWNSETGAAHEINLGAETLDRPVENTLATLVHEMVHLFNIKNGVKDCSRGNTYHNQKFKEEAEKHGLRIGFDKRIGWSLTTPGPELLEFILQNGWSKLDMKRESVGKGNDGTAKKSSSTRKYVCPVCGMTVRATKDVHIICGDCQETMVKATDSGDESADNAA